MCLCHGIVVFNFFLTYMEFTTERVIEIATKNFDHNPSEFEGMTTKGVLTILPKNEARAIQKIMQGDFSHFFQKHDQVKTNVNF